MRRAFLRARFQQAARVLVVCVCSLFLQAQAIAQEPANRGLFWKVQKAQGGDKPNQVAWMLGSVHFADASFYPMRPAIEAAFAATGHLLVEVNMEALPVEQMQAVMLQKSQYPAGETLQQHISTQTLKDLAAQMQKLGMPLQTLERQRPGFVAMTLTSLQLLQLGYDPNQGMDAYFTAKARQAGKAIHEMETLDGQLDVIAQLGDADLVIREALASLADTESDMRQTMDAWRQGDAAGLAKVVIEQPLKLHPEFQPLYERLFWQRNVHMVKNVEDCMRIYGNCFVVVGAGHLVGRDSIVDLLRQQGYQVNQQ